MTSKASLRRGAIVLVLGAGWLGLAPPAAVAQDEPDFDAAVAGTVRVISQSGTRTSTGWVIASADNSNRAGAAVIVTTLGAIKGKLGILVREPKGSNQQATVLAEDPDRNLVLLEVKDISAKQIPLSRTRPKVGRSVWASGFNRAADRAEGERAAENATIKGGRLGREFRGKISSEARADTYQIEHDAAMVDGFEGGPLLDKCGRVIGVNMKSGGQVVPRLAMTVNQGDAIMNALRADEVIAFAKSKQVEPEISDGETCGGGAAASAAPNAAGKASTAPVPAASEAVGSGSGTSVGGLLASPVLLGLLVLAGLGLAIFGFMALRRKPADPVPVQHPMRQAFAAGPESLHLAAANTETALKSANLANIQVLAFATHGLMGDELFPGSEPGLVFTPPRTATRRDDGYLTASEIMGLRLTADWVILSACNTAAGDGTEGATGLSGLARAFFYAGARDLLVSHWAVHDDVAARITAEAIRLKRSDPSLSRAGALQRAIRAVRDDPENDFPASTWAHPSAWAPYSLVGIGD